MKYLKRFEKHIKYKKHKTVREPQVGDYVILYIAEYNKKVNDFFETNLGTITQIVGPNDEYKYIIYFDIDIPTFYHNMGYFKPSDILRLATPEEIEEHKTKTDMKKYNL